MSAGFSRGLRGGKYFLGLGGAGGGCFTGRNFPYLKHKNRPRSINTYPKSGLVSSSSGASSASQGRSAQAEEAKLVNDCASCLISIVKKTTVFLVEVRHFKIKIDY